MTTNILKIAREKMEAANLALLNAKIHLDRALMAVGRAAAGLDSREKNLDRAGSGASRAAKAAGEARSLAIEVREIVRGTEYLGTRREALSAIHHGNRIAVDASVVREWVATERSL